LATQTATGDRAIPDRAAPARKSIDAQRIALFGGFLAVALLTRASMLGDPFYTNDEAFYLLVGQRMHDGVLPYVDIWDRKGPGLFLVYYLISGISRSVVAYQVAALLAAAATAQAIALMAERFSSRAGALFAGSFYLALLPMYGGGGGQSPVFYNLPIAASAAIIVGLRPRLREGRTGARLLLAMAVAGFAITFKQTAFVEAAFLGCYALSQLRAGGLPADRLLRSAVPMALVGAAPMLVFAGGMAALGHFSEFWQAMVGTNLQKPYYPPDWILERAAPFVLNCAPILLPALAGSVLKDADTPWARSFLAGWLVAAAGGVAIVPNFFVHYALPLLVPASVAASRLLSRGRVSRFHLGACTVLMAVVLFLGPAFHFAERRQSREAIASMVEDIRQRDPHPRLLVYEGPVALYGLLDSNPPTPLLFPLHLFFPLEDNASQFDTEREMRKVLAWKPTVVVTYADFPASNENSRTSPLVRDYVSHCRLWFTREARQVFDPVRLAVYGECAPDRR
jgi:hypothetical protein